VKHRRRLKKLEKRVKAVEEIVLEAMLADAELALPEDGSPPCGVDLNGHHYWAGEPEKEKTDV